MGNTKFNISSEAKEILDSLKIILDIDETPILVKLALAKGISLINPSEEKRKFPSSSNWLVPENIIKDQEYILFKHLIINELNKVISDKDINEYFAFYIEKGTQAIKKQLDEKSSFEDIRLLLLS